MGGFKMKMSFAEREARIRDEGIKCVVVGDHRAGISTLIALLGGKELPYSPNPWWNDDRGSIVENVSLSVPYSHKQTTAFKYTLRLWDTNCVPEGRYSRLRPLTYPQTDVSLVCFSTISRESFTNAANQWIPEISYYNGPTPLILVGLKADLRDQLEDQRTSEKRGLHVSRKVDLVAADVNIDEIRGRPWRPETLQDHPMERADGQLELPDPISRAEGQELARRLRAKYVEGNVLDTFSDLTSLPHEIVHTAFPSPEKPEKCIHVFPRGVGFKLVYVHTDKICRQAWSVKIPGFTRFHI